MDNKPKTKETLRSFFERNVNLLTVSGIFNALAIYSSQLPEGSSSALPFIFVLLSSVAFFPVIGDIKEHDDISVTFVLLRLTLVFSQIFLFQQISKQYPGYVQASIFIASIFVYIPTVVKNTSKYLVLIETNPSLHKITRTIFILLFYTCRLLLILALSSLTAYLGRQFIDLLNYSAHPK